MSSRTVRKIKPRRFNRRDFLHATSFGAAGLAATSTAPAASAKPTSTALDTDVLVCGGGCAGIGAALAAARQGARTLLVERAGFAGGIITSVGLPYFDGIADIKDNRIITRGIALELLAKSGVCKPDATHVNVHNPTIPNVERFKVLLDELVTAEHERLKVLFHTFACDARAQGGRITEVTVANKAGLVRIRPKVVIDCTGDADIAQWSGALTEKNAELQPMTLHFRIGNVKRTPDTSRLCRAALEKAHARGELPMFYGPGIMFLFAPDEVYVHGIRVPGDATDPDAFTRAEMQGRRDAWTMFESWRREVPGFEDAYFMTSGPFIGVRETRRIVGQHVLTEQEIVVSKKFDDAIATGCWYLDQHPNKVTLGSANATPKVQPAPYDIPYRSLVAQKVSNLLVAGRCHSATQLAASSTRVTVTAMAMGEAAGVASALSLNLRKLPAELPGLEVRKKLKSLGAGPDEHSA
ncbi:MAG: FAD-dependent oxidoreductase [Verrucomicrobia bacterium]|nr:FAD-dependent oxidoreductase [Verrucomicrobiota bacterium]